MSGKPSSGEEDDLIDLRKLFNCSKPHFFQPQNRNYIYIYIYFKFNCNLGLLRETVVFVWWYKVNLEFFYTPPFEKCSLYPFPSILAKVCDCFDQQNTLGVKLYQFSGPDVKRLAISTSCPLAFASCLLELSLSEP